MNFINERLKAPKNKNIISLDAYWDCYIKSNTPFTLSKIIVYVHCS